MFALKIIVSGTGTFKLRSFFLFTVRFTWDCVPHPSDYSWTRIKMSVYYKANWIFCLFQKDTLKQAHQTFLTQVQIGAELLQAYVDKLN